MEVLRKANRMEHVHSDIRGPLYLEALDMQKKGIDVLKLNTGNPAVFGFEVPDSIKNAMKNCAQEGMAYCDFRGMPEAREAICTYEKSKGIEGLTPDDIFIGNGVSEVVSFALLPLLNAGDEVLVPSPSYSLWGNSVYIAGGKPVFYTCDEQADWSPDLADIRSKITARTKAIVIINPNNPTGMLYPVEILRQIADLAREKGLMIFSDEIYDRLVMDGKKHVSIASLASDIPVVTLNGLSKSHCLCGYRCGWMAISGPRQLTGEYREGIVQMTSMRLCANALAQVAIPAALQDMETPASMVRPGGRLYEQREERVEVMCCQASAETEDFIPYNIITSTDPQSPFKRHKRAHLLTADGEIAFMDDHMTIVANGAAHVTAVKNARHEQEIFRQYFGIPEEELLALYKK